ncbi:MAG: 2-amino-4-hydroxy-6-hydroxymethyldihydropteridine diphosphokinase [Patescibacteria group bacterium]
MNKHKALGLGSNVGDRAKNLQRATQMLEDSGVHVIKRSSIYETEPVDCRDEGWFLNQVVFIETGLTPRECFRGCKKIEAKMGRQYSYRNAPRIIDIDLLLWNEVILNDKDLVVPHKSIHGRKFVLIPLLEIAEDIKILEWLVYAIQGQKIKKYEKD